ncbi:hypothetical protein [Microcoleus sp. herbarium12]
MNSLIFISPSKGSGFQPIISGKYYYWPPNLLRQIETIAPANMKI